jgi:hypothetical protein
MISDIVEQLVVDDVALDIAARFDTRELIEDNLRAILPDLVLIGVRPGESRMIAQSVLTAVPDAKVIVFLSDSSSAYVSEEDASWTHLPDCSAAAITSIIRTFNARDGNS